MGSKPLLLITLFAALICACMSDENDFPHLRDLWTRAGDITPSYDQKSLEKQWKRIEDRLQEILGMAFDLGQEMATRSNIDLPTISGKCMKSLFHVFSSFMKLEPWACMMFGSSGIIPSGFGSAVTYGSYDVCVDIKGKKSINGQFCTMELSLPFPKTGAYIARPKDARLPENFTVPGSLTNFMVETLNPYYYYGYTIVSICIPSQCSRHDLQQTLAKIVDLVGINATARVIGCQVQEPIIFNIYDAFAMCTLCFAITACTIGTIVHIYNRKKKGDEFEKEAGIFTRILVCFSLRRTNSQLFKTDGNSIHRTFSGLQVLTIIWLVVFHAHWFIPLNLYGSTVPIIRPIVPFNFETVRNGFYAFDTFFFISAALLMYHRLLDSNKHITVPQYVIEKVLRLGPGIVFVTATAILSRHLSNGPLWKEIVHTVSRRCEANWWTNILFVNNYISSSEQCLIWSWYTATEMQLFLISLLVLIPIKRKPNLGLYILMALFGIGIAASIANHVGYDLPPTVVLSALNLPDDLIYFMDHGLFPSYLHLTTCCLGLAVGYLLYKKPHVKFSDRMSTIAYIISCTVGFAIICSVNHWNNGYPPPGLIWSTVYSIACKVAWCFCLGWIIITCVTQGKGAIYATLTWKGFVPLGRLVYMAYLLHPLIIILYVGGIRYPIQADPKTLTFLGFGLGFGVLSAAYVYHILFEAPFLAIAQSFILNIEQDEVPENISDKKKQSLSTVTIVNNDKEYLAN